jgi:radical SAM superfamily enzyme YgiQ (UPF0313 family)
MKVLLLSTNRNHFPMPVIPLGACMVAEAAERAGHEVRLLDLAFCKDPLQAVQTALKKDRPDVVGLSVRNIDNNDIHSPAFYIRDVAAIVEVIRSLTPAPVVLGGAAVSVMPEELLRCTGASCAVLGEGEAVFPLLLRELTQNGSPALVPGTAWIEQGVFSAHPLPSSGNGCPCSSPDFSRWIELKAYLSRLSTVPVQTKLGCRFSCVYCTYRKIEGNRYRLSDPGEVAEAICRHAAQGIRHIEFVDNVFNSPYDHAFSVCEEVIRRRPAVSLQSLELNPLFIDDALISVMERAGFSGVGITVESASDRVLEGLGKGFDSAHVQKAADVVRRHGLPCVWIFMLGGPNETQETVRETLRFAERAIRPQDVAFFGLGVRIYPGTELESIARQQGLLSLPASGMLEPVFYVSPDVDYDWMRDQVRSSMDRHMNFMNSESLGLPVLSSIQRIAYRIGLSLPLWKHTRFIRRGLRLFGMDA